ncbi:unnamed protein product [Prorocentrum cordatum]|uniref:Uncharacterized protein n=1 Tax=Prorocentrum cordatum TaxID=2364126 RepID=A0ABN9VWV0_9DINO|nr:unnamed protein product [Polarella glacialis]
MAFAQQEIADFVNSLPDSAFAGAEKSKVEEWCSFLVGVDPTPKARHDLFWHLAKPYDKHGESAEFRAWVVQPAQVTFALRVQRKCASAEPALPTPETTLADTMREYLEAQEATQKRSTKALSFKLSDRLTELGMDAFPKEGLPSEENLAVFEAAGRIAKEKSRMYVGSADGEDLQRNFRPAWSRVPGVDVPVGEGSVPDRQRQMADFKRARAASEIDYPGYATFQSHLLDWGVKLILMKTATPLEVLGYTLLIAKVAEEQGGARTAYQCDILARKAMARALESGDPSWKVYFAKVDRDLAKEAKDKVVTRAGEAVKGASGKVGGGKASGGRGKLSGKADGAGKGSTGSAAHRSLSPAVPPRSRSPKQRGQGAWNHQGGWQQRSGWARQER